MPEHYTMVETPIGACGIAWSETGVTRLQLPERNAKATEARLRVGLRKPWTGPPPAMIAAAIGELLRYFAGTRTKFADIPLDFRQTSDFERQVYAAARALAWGHTTTYGAMARELGNPGAARAVGHALGRNPIPVIVPCHRIVGSGDWLGGFSAPGGATTKQQLLRLEGIEPGNGTPLLPGLELPAAAPGATRRR